MEQENTPVAFEDHIRKRPTMYIGSTDEKGFTGLIESVLVNLTELYQTDNFKATIALHPQFITLEVDGEINPALVVNALTGDWAKNMWIRSLVALSENFEARVANELFIFYKGKPANTTPVYPQNGESKFSFAFKPDASIFKNVVFDFHQLSEKLKQFAMLNRNMQLVIKDHRTELLSQNYFHYPDGIKQLFENRISQKHSGNRFRLFIESGAGKYAYQLGIGFNRAQWESDRLSFANEKHTYYGGSLEEGVLGGVVKALKKYSSRYKQKTYSFTKKKINESLTLVLAVRGPELDWAGCTKTELAVPAIKNEARILAYKATLSYLNTHYEDAEAFIAMFDKTTYVQTGRSLTHCTMACLVAKKE